MEDNGQISKTFLTLRLPDSRRSSRSDVSDRNQKGYSILPFLSGSFASTFQTHYRISIGNSGSYILGHQEQGNTLTRPFILAIFPILKTKGRSCLQSFRLTKPGRKNKRSLLFCRESRHGWRFHVTGKKNSHW